MDSTRAWIVELQTLGEAPLPPVAESVRWSDDEAAREASDGSVPVTEAPSGRLAFVRDAKGRFHPEKQIQIKNSLLAAVGFLELANASDFAANVWNLDPMPTYVLVLMAIGAVCALGMLYFVVRDAMLSWYNIRGLRAERRYLLAQRLHDRDDAQMLRTIDTFLDVNFKELGTEVVDRVATDLLMGVGALLVGVGTFLAMAGGNNTDPIYVASNLLTGYLGNTPCAMFGFVNLLWSVYVWDRARRQKAAAMPGVRGTRLEQLFRMRISSVQLHAALNGISGVVAGAASLATATLWWGYVVLAPCLVTTGMVNLFYRHRIGYDRALVQQVTSMDEESLTEALRYVDSCTQRIRSSASADPFTTLVSDTASLSSVMEAVIESQLYEKFCLGILGEPAVSRLIGSHAATAVFESTSDKIVTIDRRTVASVEDPILAMRLITIAKKVVKKHAKRSFHYQERYLLEIFGSYVCQGDTKKSRGNVADHRRSAHRHRNVHTECGRHTNDWLFGGFSIRETMMRIFD